MPIPNTCVSMSVIRSRHQVKVKNDGSIIIIFVCMSVSSYVTLYIYRDLDSVSVYNVCMLCVSYILTGLLTFVQLIQLLTGLICDLCTIHVH